VPKGRQTDIGFTGCGKTHFLEMSEKQNAPECPVSDPWTSGDGFLSPFSAQLHGVFEFFRSLFSR